MKTISPLNRATAFAKQYGLRVPILLAPMAGACPPELSIAVANAGGMGAAGVLTMSPDAIGKWVTTMRRGSNGAFQLNTRVPDPIPDRDLDLEHQWRNLLANWGPPVPEAAATDPLPCFEGQLEAMIAAGPAVISSHMGLLPAKYVERMKSAGIRWFASITTTTEAIAAEDAGADAVVAQGVEAGGHRASFDPNPETAGMVGLISLIPAVVDQVGIPVIATGGIADGRGVVAALLLGASAVQIGTGFLRSPEAQLASDWSNGLARSNPEDTVITIAFSGRLARSLATSFVRAAKTEQLPANPYPIQNNLTKPMREEASRSGRLAGMSAWAGQSSGLARPTPAGEIVTNIWEETTQLLSQ